MEPNNIARIIFVVIAIITALGLYLVKIFGYKDLRITEEINTVDAKGKPIIETMTLIQKKNYERKFIDGINIIASWIIVTLGVAQPWQLLNFSTLLGMLLTLFVGLMPVVIFGGFFFGFKLQKNDFDWLLILDADVKDKIFKLYNVEYFLEGNTKYMKADTVKDALNDNFQAILIDVERERFWKAQMDGMETQPVFAEDVMITDDAVIIETHKKEGAIITLETLDSGSEREIANKVSMASIIKEQEETIVDLEDENNLLKAQRKKGIITLTAERIAVFFNLFDELAGLTITEQHSADKVKDAIEDIEYEGDED